MAIFLVAAALCNTAMCVCARSEGWYADIASECLPSSMREPPTDSRILQIEHARTHTKHGDAQTHRHALTYTHTCLSASRLSRAAPPLRSAPLPAQVWCRPRHLTVHKKDTGCNRPGCLGLHICVSHCDHQRALQYALALAMVARDARWKLTQQI